MLKTSSSPTAKHMHGFCLCVFLTLALPLGVQAEHCVERTAIQNVIACLEPVPLAHQHTLCLDCLYSCVHWPVIVGLCDYVCTLLVLFKETIHPFLCMVPLWVLMCLCGCIFICVCAGGLITHFTSCAGLHNTIWLVRWKMEGCNNNKLNFLNLWVIVQQPSYLTCLVQATGAVFARSITNLVNRYCTDFTSSTELLRAAGIKALAAGCPLCVHRTGTWGSICSSSLPVGS